MQKFNQPVRQLLNRAQRRFVRSRPGSVLILVVALLILMAIIGTAFMSMAQADRSTAVIHSNNTEVDLLIDGLVELVKSTITNDLFVQGNYRPVNRYNTGESNTYNYYTGVGDDFVTANPGTKFVSSRAPELFNELGGYLPGSVTPDPIVSNNNPPLWRYITSPLLGGQFSSPVPSDHSGNPAAFLIGESLGGPPYTYSQRSSIPGSGFNLFPGAMRGTGMPAWVDNPTAPTRFFPAADADGDGIADSGYIKLPMGSVNGVTYYAAVRIVDNNGAVNANTAWQHNTLTTGTGAPLLPGDFFTSNVDLLDLLHPVDQNASAPSSPFNLLLDTRFGRNLGSSPYPTQTSSALAFNDDGTQRTDFSYWTLTEAQFMGLNRRMKNPGIAANTGANIFYQPLSINESLTMARNYVLRDPGVFNSALSPSLLEQYLPYSTSVQSSASSIPYSPVTGVAQWYGENFSHYASFITNRFYSVINARPMLTSENAESEFVPSKFRDLGQISPEGPTWAPIAPPDPTAPANGYRFGDTVIWNKHRYVCINPLGASGGGLEGVVAPTAGSGVPLPNFGAGYRYVATTSDGLPVPSKSWAIDNDTWVYMPWTNNPTKISANSGTFGQLMLAFWSVMAEKQNSTPTVSATDKIWEPPFPVNQYNPLALDSPRMFRSPMRLPHGTGDPDVGGWWHLSPPQVMQLRAAIAAVNTIDMRDSDDSVTARTVHLFDPDTNTQPNPAMQDVIATVYGSERQPFITKVYATNSWVNTGDPNTSQHGYVAIELFNPDPVRPMSLSGWALGAITRYQPGTPPSKVLPPDLKPAVIAFDAADPPWIDSPTSKAPVIPPLGSIVIASSDTPPNGVNMPPTLVKPDPITGALPAAGDTALYIVKNLVTPGPAAVPDGAINRELVLFRPRVADALTGAGILSAWIGMGNTSAPVGTGPLPLVPNGATDIANANPWPYYYEGMVAGGVPTPNPADMVPVDAYDFSGLAPLLSDPGPVTASEWYYVRPNDYTVAGRKAWHWVYPGHYAYDLTSPGPTFLPRLIDGTWSSDFPTAGGGIKAATTQAGITPGTPIPFGTVQVTAKAEYRDIPLVLNTTDFAGPNTFRRSDTSGAAVGFPYGGFARNGDIMDVPFIGSYRLAILDPLGIGLGALKVIEMNPATMDSVMALGLSQRTWAEPVENVFTALPQNAAAGTIGGDAIFDTLAIGLNQTPLESVGRFAPISNNEFLGAPTTPVSDFAAPTAVGGVNPFWLYHFATRLFDYVTVQSPQQDYVPDVDPGVTDRVQDPSTGFALMTGVSPRLKFTAGASTAPFPVANTTINLFNAEPTNLNGATEETAPKVGLVNVNTAPWRVLASVPWVPPDYPNWGSDDGSRIRMNVMIGLSIARYRDIDDGTGIPIVPGGPTVHGHGPFKSIYELLDVPVFPFLAPPPSLPSSPTLLRNILKVAPYAGPLPSPYTPEQGILSPAFGLNQAPVYGDFQSRYLMMNRISNLVTTRSDSFTAYVLIEGWQDPETSQAKRVVSRRTSFLIDRTGVTPISRDPTVTFIPSNQ